MAIPKINKTNISGALKYIEANGVPLQNQSTKYELVTEDGKKYPPKHVIAVAAYLAHGSDITNTTFTAVEAKDYLKRQGYNIVEKLEKVKIAI